MKFPTGFNQQALTLYSQAAAFDTTPAQETTDNPEDIEDPTEDDSTQAARCRDFHVASIIARERKDTFEALRSEQSKLDHLFKKAKKEGFKHVKDQVALSVLRQPYGCARTRIHKHDQRFKYSRMLKKLVNEQPELTNLVQRKLGSGLNQ